MATRRTARIINPNVKPGSYPSNLSLNVDDPDPDVIVSLTYAGTHMPVIDLDIPCSLVPSKTLGHYHLYLDVEMTLEKHMAILKALYHAGVVELGYYNAAMRDGMSAVRFPYQQEWAEIQDQLRNGKDIFDVEPVGAMA